MVYLKDTLDNILFDQVSGEIKFLSPSLYCVGLIFSVQFCCALPLPAPVQCSSARRDSVILCVIISSCFQVKMSLDYSTDVTVRLKKPCCVLNIACGILPPSALTFQSFHNHNITASRK
jgi:hypothetical protein